jgi:hypothetical protein
MAKIGCNRRCFRAAWKITSMENPVRVIEVFIEELDLTAMGFAGVSVLARGGNSAVSARRAECPRTWSSARA